MSELEKIFDNVNNWLKYAETKNAMLLAFNGVSLFGILKLAASNHGIMSIEPINSLLTYVAPIFIGVSILLLLLSFVPQTNMLKVLSKLNSEEKPKEEVVEKKYNLLYFEHLKILNASELVKMLGIENPNQIQINYAEQIITNSGIASEKFQVFKVAIWFTILGLTGVLIGILVLIYNWSNS